MNVKLIRMWSGEDVIADLIDDKTDMGEEVIVISNPIVAIPAGNGQMGFAPWSPLLKGKNEELSVSKKYVVYIADTQEQIADQYKEMFSVIKAPSKKLIM
jgi:hypothetical protein